MSASKKVLLIVGAIIVVAIIGFGIFFVMKKVNRQDDKYGPVSGQQNPDNHQAQNQSKMSADAFMQQYGRNCDATTQPTFSNSPLALDKMAYIVPMGKVLDGHVTPTDHVYVAPINPNVPDNTYDVVMPADGKVITVGRMPAQYIGDRKDVTLAPDDFRVVLSFSCRYYAIFIHVHKLSDKLAAAIGDLPDGQTKDVDVPLKAGELIAHLGGSTFDWTMIDAESKLSGFISPDLYQGESWKIHTVDPFSVYAGDLKAKLEAMSLRTVAPFGGKIDYDVAGALIGNWFKEGTNGYMGASQDRYYDGHLSIAPDPIDPTATVYSVGNWNGAAKQYVVKGNFDASTITTASGVTKIELVQYQYLQANGQPYSSPVLQKGMKLNKAGQVVGTVLLQVMPNEKLKLEQFPGKTVDQVSDFTSDAMVYER